MNMSDAGLMTLSETRISTGFHEDYCASCGRELKKGVAFRLLYEGTKHGNLFICKRCIDTDKNKGLKDELE